MQIIYRLLVLLIGALLLAGCASRNTAAQQAFKEGQSDYQSQQYDASFIKLQQAAEAGDPNAEYALGYMYYYGQGTPQDTQTALSWINKAALQGQPQAIQALKLLNKQSPNSAGADMVSANATDNGAAKTYAAKSSGLDGAATKETTASAKTTVVTTKKEAANGSQVKPVVKKSTAKTTVKKNGTDDKLLKAPGHYYTLQLMAARKKTDIINFMQINKLSSKAAYYVTEIQDRPMYVLVYGEYPTIQAAKAAIGELPAAVQAEKPWVKPLASVQKAMQQGTYKKQ